MCGEEHLQDSHEDDLSMVSETEVRRRRRPLSIYGVLFSNCNCGR